MNGRAAVPHFDREDDVAFVPPGVAADSELSDPVQRALDRLPSRMRAAVVLRYCEDMSEAEVAEALGISQGTVKSTVSRAVAKLRIDAELLKR
jgi:RNA polymerase sigma factor (sigma-70 family)